MSNKSAVPVLVATIFLFGCQVQRVKLTVDETRIERVSDHVIYGSMISDSEPTREVEVLVYEVSSGVDITPVFEDRQIQVRCKVDGKGDPMGYGPFERQEPTAARSTVPPRSDGRHAYTIYAFTNLATTNLVGTQFVDTPLESISFSEISCFVIGVIKAPALFPRSNELTLTRAKFLDLVAKYRGTQPNR